MIQKKKKIHTREIDITTYEGNEDVVIVEGILKDDILLDSHRLDGERIPAGIIHHMIVRIEVQGLNLVIQDVEVEMPTVPFEFCRETHTFLEKIKGVSIVSGFTKKVTSLVGGPKGCAHLLTLLTAMAPAAIQGALTAKARKAIDPETGVQIAMERFKNTCWVWRDDGPFINKYKDLTN